MIAYVSEGEAGLRWHQVAIDYCERHEGERFRRWPITLNTNIADQYEALEDYPRAIEHVERSLALAKQEAVGRARRGRPALPGPPPSTRRGRRPVRAAAAGGFGGRHGRPTGYADEERAECLLYRGRGAGAGGLPARP